MFESLEARRTDIINKLSRLKLTEYFQPLVILFLITSIFMGRYIHVFAKKTGFDSPQHNPKDDIVSFFKYIDAHTVEAYYQFFKIDFIWSILFTLLPLLLILNSLKHFQQKEKSENILFSDIPIIIILILGVGAWTSDQIENYLYFTKQSSGLGFIVSLKKVLYAFYYMTCIYFVIRINVSKKEVEDFILFLKSSSFSLLTIGLLFILLTKVEQGGTIIIDIYWNPWNLVYIFILINFAAIVISHYPSYFSEALDPKSESIWHKYPLDSSKMFGLIHFENDGASNSGKNEIDNIMRRSLGTILYLVWIFVLFNTLNQYKLFWHPTLVWSIFLTFVFIVLSKHYSLMRMASSLSISKEKDENINSKSTKDYSEQDSYIDQWDKMRKAVQWFLLTATLTLVFLILLVLVCSLRKDFNIGYSYLAIVTFILNVFAFIYFRETRAHLMYFIYLTPKWRYKYAEFSKNVEVKKIQEHKKEILSFHPDPLKYVGNLSNHIYYLRSIKNWFLILLVITIVISIFFITWVSPLAYIIFYFTSAIYIGAVIIKHFIYYSKELKAPNILDQWQECYQRFNNRVKKENNGNGYLFKSKLSTERFLKTKSRFRKFTPALIAGVIIVGSYSINQSNGLHEFPLVAENPNNLLSLAKFREQHIEKSLIENLKGKPTFSIASFGGGLKANYWTINLLHEIEKSSGEDFFDATISMSGVSGGGMGLACYPFIHGLEINERENLINGIGEANILSIDASYIFFQDLLRELIPFDLGMRNGSDRSHRAMHEYNRILTGDDSDIHDIAFRTQWKKFYDDKGYYPPLIMNTTSTNLNYGYAISLDSVDLPGGINIVDYTRDISISYFDAASTINRFAFVSPAAAVPEKGHFVDGGYFENSGLLSTTSFLHEFRNDGSERTIKLLDSLQRKNHILNFINGKSYWIRHQLRSKDQNSIVNLEELKMASKSAEIPAIISTIAGTDMLPTYFIESFTAKSETYIPIMMPFVFDYEDVKKTIGGDAIDSNKEVILEIIRDNKQKIIEALQKHEDYNYDNWGIVQPTLSRLLSEPDRQYQKAMIKYHPDVRAQLSKIDSLVAM